MTTTESKTQWQCTDDFIRDGYNLGMNWQVDNGLVEKALGLDQIAF
jgi:hypothetical protein